MRNVRVFLMVVLTVSVASACKTQPLPDVPPLSITVDAALGPVPAQIPDDGTRGARPLAVIRDEEGVESEFIANEIIIVPRSRDDLDDLVRRYGGTIVGDDSVPAPPPQLGITVAPDRLQATEYLVRIDPSAVSYDDLVGVGARAGVGGAHVVSSELGARLLATAIREQAEGRSVSPNFTHQPQSVLRSTRERPNGAAAPDDIFNTGTFPRFQAGGSRSNVTAAMQWLAARGITRRVRVAIIDGGFWLNAVTGQPLTSPVDGSDLPNAPIQYDFVGDDFIAGAMNPGACTGGTTCQWHGNNSASVATGPVNNNAAAAGTGGQVSDPMLFHSDIRDRMQRNRAVRTAVVWGADVISMSFAGRCNYACRQFVRRKDTDRGYREAVAAGIVLVAAAGNDTNDVMSDNYYHPCITDGVICVGALADDGNSAAAYSNYGAGLDIWAPSNVRAMPNGVTTPQVASAGGTSAAAPFIAGIAAMMKAINPALTSDQVRDLLRDSAWTDSPDGKVSHYVNAYDAVRRASNGVLPPDRFEPDDSVQAARAIPVGQHDDLTLHQPSDRDYYRVTLATGTAMLTTTFADAIGAPYVNISKADDCGGAVELSNVLAPNQRAAAYSVTAGQYVIQVSAGLALPYDLGITSSASSPGRDSFEGVGGNDSFGAASFLGTGGGGPHTATIVAEGDVDVYRVQSTGTIFHPKVGGKRFMFSILQTDMPITVDLYDQSQQLIQTLSSSVDCKALPSFTLNTGTHFFRVRSTSTGTYVFAVGERYESGILYDMRSLWRVLRNPAGPVEFDITGPYVRYAFEREREGAGSIEITGRGVHATLIDSAGNVIAEGVRGERGDLERLPLQGTVAGEPYVIRLDRDIGVAPDRGLTLPRLRGQLRMVE